jgi:hypothetical protein
MKMGDFCMVFNEQLNMSESVPSNASPQGNHIGANNGNGGNTNGNGKAIGIQPPPAAIASNNQSATANSTGKQQNQKSTTPPSKYMRKPINKK